MESYNIIRTVYKVSDFLAWQRNGTLELSPSFQRRSVWSAPAKSYFLDTVARGLPIPIIIIREVTDLKTLTPRRQVVDGQQRIRTVISYVDPTSLRDYSKSRDFFQISRSHNAELAKKGFSDLPENIRRRILDYQFSVHILPSDMDDKQVLEVFQRMNATGYKLNAQELRNACFFGVFKKAMYELAYEQLERWRGWHVFSENNIARMLEVEMTSDLVLLMYKGISTKSKTSLDTLYRDLDDDFPDRSVVEGRFRTVMDSIEDTIGTEMVSTQYTRQVLFYVLFGLVYDLQYGLRSELVKTKKRALPHDFRAKLLAVNQILASGRAPENVKLGMTTRTSTVASRKTLFSYLEAKCRSA